MTTLQVSKRGSLTLPRTLRRALGLDKGGVMVAEMENGAIVLRPAVAFPIEIYSEKRIAEFDAADAELAAAMKKRKGSR